jgi:uncharacterized protein YdeI (YjbR/CyaY-like superfamily)
MNGQAAPRRRVVSPVFFESAQKFRAWLEQNHTTAVELIAGFHKVDSGRPSMTWPQAVDEALCFGWIDGVRRRIDETSYLIRFTPRRKGSIWSAVNVAKAESLIAEGRMRPIGMAAYAARSNKKTGVYSFEQERPVELAAAEVRAFKRSHVAWTYFQSTPPSYRKIITYWVVSAKHGVTRARRLAQLVQACSEQRRLLK